MANQQIQSEPSFNPAAQDSPAIAFEYITRNLLKDTKVCIPAVVSDYDRANNTVTVQPAITEPTESGEYVNSTAIKVPALQLSGGGFVISFPFKSGDTGWLVACDRDISLFKQGKTVSNPNTNRIHSLEDSFFIPDYVSSATAASDDLVIKQIDGNTAIIISDKSISITTDTAVDINTMTATVNGNLSVNGNITTSGSITATGDVTGSGISLSTHTHGGVQAGSDNTGGPQ